MSTAAFYSVRVGDDHFEVYCHDSTYGIYAIEGRYNTAEESDRAADVMNFRRMKQHAKEERLRASKLAKSLEEQGYGLPSEYRRPIAEQVVRDMRRRLYGRKSQTTRSSSDPS